MATEHCGHCGSQLCGHGACPECNPCGHCTGGDRGNKHFDDEYDDDEREMREEHLREYDAGLGALALGLLIAEAVVFVGWFS